MALRKGDFLLFALNTNHELAIRVADLLAMKLAAASATLYSNKESRLDIAVSVRGKDVFIIQSALGEAEISSVNNSLMELLMFAYHCKTACARRVVAVIPYLHYSTQSTMRRRSSIPAKLVASMLCRTGIANFITVDLHSKEIQGFYDRPVDNLRASPFLTAHIQTNIAPRGELVIVALNPHTAARATPYAERLRVQLAVLHGTLRDQCETHSDIEDNVSSPVFQDCDTFEFPTRSRRQSTRTERTSISYDAPGFLPKSKPTMYVVGEVSGKIAVIVNDLIDDAEPYTNAARILKENGAKEVYVVVTHGIFSGNCPDEVESSDIDSVVVTNTIAHDEKKERCSKIETIDISILLSEAVRRIHNGESIGHLFRNVSIED